MTEQFGKVGSRTADAHAGAPSRPAVLVVDDHPENVRVLEMILEPLDVDVITAHSGEEALRVLLSVDVAVIVLDVRMPGMDGFETAAFVKKRERTRHVPIIFLTALANDRDQALSGYEAGAVDYIEKPVEPLVLQSKVAAFAELHAARVEVERQAALLRAAEAREAARAIQEVRERGERRYRDLSEAMPAMVFALDPDGKVTYRSNDWGEYTGGDHIVDIADADSAQWSIVHADDRRATQQAWADAFEDPARLRGSHMEVRVRMRRHDGAWLWHLIRTVPRFDSSGTCTGWVGTATEIDASERIATTQRALSEVGGILVNTADVESALQLIAGLVVEDMVDWCSIDVLDDDGVVHRRALQVAGRLEPSEAAALARILPPDGDHSPALRVALGERPRRALLDRDGHPLSDSDDASTACATCVPLVVRGELIGVVSIGVMSDGRRLGSAEREFGRALATRIAPALDGARQFRRAQDRAQASEVLDAIADGVTLVDQHGVVRLWNPAAAAITGVRPQEIIGRPIEELLPTWSGVVERVPVTVGGTARAGVTTVPLTTIDGRDVWLSVSAVGFARGVAFAFRDLTEERAVERMKSDFVATVSHELRTPLTSIHGAAVTLTRDDIDLAPEVHDKLLDVISQQSVQLAEIVDSVLTASRIDAGQLELRSQPVDTAELIRDVVDGTRARLGNERGVRLELPEHLPLVSADRVHLRQVLENLVENAIKYSPAGGDVTVRAFDREGSVAIEVEDTGIGIASHDHRRIFEKFYRADADMSLGVGGTGLGLFIVRELVRQMSGRVEVVSTPGQGSTFQVTLPTASLAGVAATDDAVDEA